MLCIKYQTIPTLGAIRFYFEVLVITYIEFIAFGWAPLVLVGSKSISHRTPTPLRMDDNP